MSVTLSAGFHVSGAGPASTTAAVRGLTGLLSPSPLATADARELTRTGMKASFQDDGWLDESLAPSRRGDLSVAAQALAVNDGDTDLATQAGLVLQTMSMNDLLPVGVGWGSIAAQLMHPEGAAAMKATAALLTPLESPPDLSDERVAWTWLQLAQFTGSTTFLDTGLSRLGALAAIDRPTGGLVWAGVPRGAPDVAACADGVMAATLAWKLTSDAQWLALARRYAHIGLQFVLATDLPGVEYSRYSVTASPASTDDGTSLLGVVSDALGARLALAFLELHFEMSDEAWDTVALGILGAISKRQSSSGSGLLQEGYDLRRRQSYGATRAPHVFGVALLASEGSWPGPYVSTVGTPDGSSIHVSGMSSFTNAVFDLDDWALVVEVAPDASASSWVFVGGLVSAPPSVKIDSVSVSEVASLKFVSTGWNYEESLGGILIKLPPGAEILSVGFPVPDVDMDQFPANVDCDDSDPAVFPGQDEVCNGKDDNCVDGIDEPQETGWLECGIGGCAHMEPACVNGSFVECDPFFGQTPEICDGVDNDCDGETDEEVGNITCGVGQCEHLIYACDACDPFLGAGPEVCDSVDNDCDGVIDESPGTVVCGLGACAHVISVCEECDPFLGQGVEVCNLIDDDCDGETDEGQPTVLCGVGACQTEIAACAPCDATAGALPEVCNLIDDDCDGETDEDTPTIQCGTGICERPVPACQVCDPVQGLYPKSVMVSTMTAMEL